MSSSLKYFVGILIIIQGKVVPYQVFEGFSNIFCYVIA